MNFKRDVISKQNKAGEHVMKINICMIVTLYYK